MKKPSFTTFSFLGLATMSTLGIVCFPEKASAATVSISPVADGFMRGTFILDDTSTFVRTGRSGGFNIEHGIYEFDLNGVIPNGATITEAKLILTSASFLSNTGGNPIPVRVDTFVGDGNITFADFDPAEASGGNQVSGGSFANGTPSNTVFEFVLNDLTLLSNLSASNGIVGYRTETEDFAIFSVASSEATSGIPQLEITFDASNTSIPEPSSLLSILAISGFGLTKFRKKS